MIERTSKNFNNELIVSVGKQEEYILIHDKTVDSLTKEIDLKQNAHLKVIGIILADDKIDIKINLLGSGAEVEQHLLLINSNNQKSELNVTVNHIAGETKSQTFIYKVLDDQASNYLKGMIDIKKGAQLSQGLLIDKSLLLSDSINNRSIPGLNINANDVQVNHSSAQSYLNSDDIIYLASRGLSATAARDILIDGFVAMVYEEINQNSLKTEVRDLIKHKLQHA